MITARILEIGQCPHCGSPFYTDIEGKENPSTYCTCECFLNGREYRSTTSSTIILSPEKPVASIPLYQQDIVVSED